MKTFKLLLIFAILFGIIFVILNLDNCQDIKTDSEEQGSKIDITARCKEIRDAWREQSEWNEALYTEQKNSIEQENLSNRYQEGDYQSVRSTLRESATNKAYDSYHAALKATKFDKNHLNNQFNGIITMMKDFGLSEDQRIKEIRSIDSLYKEALKISESQLKCTPKFEIDKKENWNWTSLKDHYLDYIAKAQRVKNNQYYKEIKMIPGIEDGLSDNTIKKKLESQDETYYENLSGQILNYFRKQIDNSSRNPNQLLTLKKKLDKIGAKLADESQWGVNKIQKLSNSIANTINELQQTSE